MCIFFKCLVDVIIRSYHRSYISEEKDKGCARDVLHEVFKVESRLTISNQAHDVVTTLNQRRINVMCLVELSC